MKYILRTGFLILTVFFVFSSFSFHKKQAKDDVFVVVLDAGHGGHDPGKVARDGKSVYYEKDVALKIVQLVGKELEKNPKIKVIYTRTSDVFVNLYKRGEIANKAKADLFVSVHCNAHSSQAHGSETYVLGLNASKQNFEVAKAENEVIYLEENHEVNYAGYDLNSPESFIGLEIEQEQFLDQSIILAKIIEDNFAINLNRKSRGVKAAGFIVLHQTYMPSVLIETGFITNRNERSYLLSNEGQNSFARNIVSAILSYKSYLDENVGDDIQFEIRNDVLSEISNGELTIKSNRDTTQQTSQTIENVIKGDEISEDDIFYKVQIAASSSEIDLTPSNFNGLNSVSVDVGKDFYRYFYGSSINYNDALILKEKAVEAGYSSSYVVAFKNGERISLAEALKSNSN